MNNQFDFEFASPEERRQMREDPSLNLHESWMQNDLAYRAAYLAEQEPPDPSELIGPRATNKTNWQLLLGIIAVGLILGSLTAVLVLQYITG